MIKVLKEIQSFTESSKSYKVGEVLELPQQLEKDLIHFGFVEEYDSNKDESLQKDESQTRKRKTKEDKEIYQTKDE